MQRFALMPLLAALYILIIKNESCYNPINCFNISVNYSLFAGKSFLLQLTDKLVNIGHSLPCFSDWRILHCHNLGGTQPS